MRQRMSPLDARRSDTACRGSVIGSVARPSVTAIVAGDPVSVVSSLAALERLVLRRRSASPASPCAFHDGVGVAVRRRRCGSASASPGRASAPRPVERQRDVRRRAGDVVVVVVPGEDGDACCASRLASAPTSGLLAHAVLDDRVERRRRRRWSPAMRSAPIRLNMRKTLNTGRSMPFGGQRRGSRRSTAGPRTRTPRSARLRGSRRAGRRGRACARSSPPCSSNTSSCCGSRAAGPGRRRSRRDRIRR